jgi:outer membrane lipoprotein LolB
LVLFQQKIVGLGRTFLCVVLCVVLVGCVSMRAPTLTKQQQQFAVQPRAVVVGQLIQLTHWHASGAFSVQTPTQALMGDFTFISDGAAWRVDISGGLGVAHMAIGSDAHGLWYADTHGHVQHVLSVAPFMQAQLGFVLPVQVMLDWMKGLPAPGAAKTQVNRFGQLTQLSQLGWLIHYRDYGRYLDMPLPGRLQLAGAHQIITIVVKKWLPMHKVVKTH